MSDRQNLIIEPLSNEHNRPAFHSGAVSLDSYIKKQAKQAIERRISRVFIASKPDNSSHILGYYTLSTLSIELSHHP